MEADLEEVFNVAAVNLDDSQLVTLKLDSGNYLRFQPDTGAQCNVIPLHLYKKASKDYNLENMTPLKTAISAYGGSNLQLLAKHASASGVVITSACWIASLSTTRQYARS